jgi:hypothetical protein
VKAWPIHQHFLDFTAAVTIDLYQAVKPYDTVGTLGLLKLQPAFDDLMEQVSCQTSIYFSIESTWHTLNAPGHEMQPANTRRPP